MLLSHFRERFIRAKKFFAKEFKFLGSFRGFSSFGFQNRYNLSDLSSIQGQNYLRLFKIIRAISGSIFWHKYILFSPINTVIKQASFNQSSIARLLLIERCQFIRKQTIHFYRDIAKRVFSCSDTVHLVIQISSFQVNSSGLLQLRKVTLCKFTSDSLKAFSNIL